MVGGIEFLTQLQINVPLQGIWYSAPKITKNSPTVEESSPQAFTRPDEVRPEVLAAEIGRGNREAEAQFYTRYQSGLVLMLERRTGDRARAEDLAQDALITVLTQLRDRGIDDPARLDSFVHQTAKYQFIGWIRKTENRNELIPTADDRPQEAEAIEGQRVDARSRDSRQVLVPDHARAFEAQGHRFAESSSGRGEQEQQTGELAAPR